MTHAEIKQATDRFREDWPTIQKDKSDRARSVKHLAYLYKTHQDYPTFALLIAAHTAWREARDGR